MQEMNVQTSVSKSVYVFLAISIVSAFMSVIVGSFVIVNLFKTPFYGSTNANYWFPLLLNCIGFISGLITKDKAKTNEVSPADGCAVDLSIYFNLIILIVYIFLLLSIAYLLAQAWA
jgi:hypothetical protein